MSTSSRLFKNRFLAGVLCVTFTAVFVVGEIADTGKGISPDTQDRIFEPFFTTKPTNIVPGGPERFTGTGLGLAFVQKYMEDLGGSVSVASEPGRGTTFSLKFLRGN